MLSGSSFGPGSTSFAPAIAPENGMLQAFAWNRGTMTRIVSCAPKANPSAAQAANACSKVERWL